MNEFEQSDIEKEANDSYSTCYQNEIRYKQKENAFIRKNVNVFDLLLHLLQN